ncbi:MAG: AtpZ/AtpI family protein [Chitinophagales bacterium]|nr:AtpZ/AtpI family protein [Candidatus Calescibacterium sp.]MDW8274600.1 AtpZ/AtpI family protein [Chitinophagales bacterium]
MKAHKPINNYLKYSTMAIEMAATIGIGIGLGHLADKYWNCAPYGKATGALVFVIIAIYRAIKDFLKK